MMQFAPKPESIPIVAVLLVGAAAAAINSIIGAMIMVNLASKFRLPKLEIGQTFKALFIGRLGVEALLGFVSTAVILSNAIDPSMHSVFVGALLLVGFFVVSATISRFLDITPEWAMLLHLTTLVCQAALYGAVTVVVLVVAFLLYPDTLAELTS
ncbi:MAG: hypothetical protein KDA83_20710 [Planctomycetales bacterium]|nr:hypothetical protein [Planctomycetales bacterium]